nr:minor capsid protein [Deinococcus sp. HSC-46F16]
MRLTELLRVLDLAALRERRRLDDMRRAVVRQYRGISLEEAAGQLRAALDAPNPASARARTELTLKALDIAVRELGLPPERAEQIVRRAVRDRVQTHDELLRLQNPALSFNDPAEVQARAVGTARRDMNRYWEKEQRRFRNDVARTIREAIRKGLDPDKAATLLEKRLGVSRSRAVLIATDQMLTAAANADRQRQRDMGVKEYVWRTVGDKKVRREHQLRNGRRYAWATGGEYPGRAIRCRCRALPIIVRLPAPPEVDRAA